MSRPLPVKSFSLSVCLTSSPINWEECPLSLHWCLFVSPLHPPRPFLSVCPSLFSSLSNSIFVRVLSFFIHLSLAAPLFAGKKRCCVMHISKPTREGKGRCCRGSDASSWQLVYRGSCWASGGSPPIHTVVWPPTILTCWSRKQFVKLKKKSLKNPITCFFFLLET